MNPGMPHQKSRRNKLHGELQKNIIQNHPSLLPETVDETAYDYPMVDRSNLHAEVTARIQSITAQGTYPRRSETVQKELILDEDDGISTQGSSSTLIPGLIDGELIGESHDLNAKYIVLEKISGDESSASELTKNDKIKFGLLSNKKALRDGTAKCSLASSLPFHFKEKKLIKSVHSTRDIHCNKCPGSMHLIVDSIMGYCNVLHKVAGLSIRLEITGNLAEPIPMGAGDMIDMQSKILNTGAPGALHPTNRVVSFTKQANGSKKNKQAVLVIESPTCQENTNVVVDFYMQVPITADGPLSIKAMLVHHTSPSFIFKSAASVVAECEFQINSIDMFQNKLFEMTSKWSAIKNAGFVKSMRQFLFSPGPPIGILRMFASYIATDELHTINCEVPQDFITLSKWLAVRQQLNNLLFAGYLTVKYSSSHELEAINPPVQEKKMYVKWLGFTIHLFDAFCKKLVTSIDISNAELSRPLLSQGTIIFRLKDGIVQLQCDTTEKLSGCIEALSTLFPQAVGQGNV